LPQPLLIPASRDPLDTRPDASGAIPGVHTNVPLYQHLPTQSPDVVQKAFLNMLSGGIEANPHGAASYWKGVAQSFNPTTVSGAANLASNLFPGNLHSGTVPREFASSVPGIRIVRAKSGDPTVDYTGYLTKIQKPPAGIAKGSSSLGYNEKGEIVGSISGHVGPEDTYIHQVYVRPDFRKTSLFHDLVRPVIQRGRPVGGYVINPKLKGLVDRLTARSGGDLYRDIQGVTPEDRSGY
jgi:hypothetical protein